MFWSCHFPEVNMSRLFGENNSVRVERSIKSEGNSTHKNTEHQHVPCKVQLHVSPVTKHQELFWHILQAAVPT